MTIRSELLSNLTEEQVSAALACKNIKELISLIEDNNIELTEEQLAAVYGGGCGKDKDDDDKPHRRYEE